jgi:hypothetical protein
MSKIANKSSWRVAFLLAVLGFTAIYLVLALACLWQWGSADPWSRIDFFSGSAILLSSLLAIQQLSLVQKLPSSEEIESSLYELYRLH